jgi:hypothetical protein
MNNDTDDTEGPGFEEPFEGENQEPTGPADRGKEQPGNGNANGADPTEHTNEASGANRKADGADHGDPSGDEAARNVGGDAGDAGDDVPGEDFSEKENSADASAKPNGKEESTSPFGDTYAEGTWRDDLPTVAQAKAIPLSVFTPPALRALGRLYAADVSECWGVIRQLVAAAKDPAVTETKLQKLAEKAARQWRKEQKQAETKDDAGGSSKAPSQTTQLVNLAKGVEFAHTDMEVEVARYPVDGHLEAARIGSETFTKWLRFRFYQETKTSPRSEALKEAVEDLKARALFEGPEVAVHVRVGFASEVVWYLDLGSPDHSVVEITAAGWRVIPQSPIWFPRSPSMQPLPIPQRGGKLSELRPFLNLRDGTTDLPEALKKRKRHQQRHDEAVAKDDDYVLSVGHLICTLNPIISYPILAFIGPHGSGKTTVKRVHRRLIDPNRTESKLLPRSADDIMIGAQYSWVQSFDNVSPPVPEESGDALCVVATGGSKEKRRLYTDDEGHVIAVRRPIIMTGILDILTRPDLVSRALFREVVEIPPKQRITEKKFWKAFDKVHPRVLGALLDVVVRGLGQPEPDLDELPRMADAAAWVARCEAALGWEPGTFADAMKRNAQDSLDILLGGDPVADAVRELMDELTRQPDGTKLWEGLVTDLMQALRKKLGEGVYRTRGLPKAPNILSGALRRASPALAKIGLLVRLQHTNQGSAVTLFIDKLPPEEPDQTGAGAGAAKHNRDERHPADSKAAAADGGAADGSDTQKKSGASSSLSD